MSGRDLLVSESTPRFDPPPNARPLKEPIALLPPAPPDPKAALRAAFAAKQFHAPAPVPGVPGRPFTKGNPGGLGGRKPKGLIEAKARQRWKHRIADDHPIIKLFPHLKGKTFGDAAIDGAFTRAASGYVDALEFLADRLDGKVAQEIDVNATLSTVFNEAAESLTKRRQGR